MRRVMIVRLGGRGKSYAASMCISMEAVVRVHLFVKLILLFSVVKHGYPDSLIIYYRTHGSLRKTIK